MSEDNENPSAVEYLSSTVRQLTKIQTKRVLLALLEDIPSESGVGSVLLDKISQHINAVIEEEKSRINDLLVTARLSPVPDNVMEQGLETVDSLLDIYQKSADKKYLTDATLKMNDLFVILKSQNDHQWQVEMQRRMNRINGYRGRDLPDPNLFANSQKRGWMDKRTRSFKGWKRRWVVLKGTNLTYFAKTELASTSSAEWGDIIKEGMLKKKKQGKGWKQRWIQIRPEGLVYYKAQKDKDPIGTLPFSECDRAEMLAEKMFEVNYNGTKYYFSMDSEEEFQDWAPAFTSLSCPKVDHDANDKRDLDMSYFTIRGVLDVSTSVLEDKQTDKPFSFSLTVEGGKTYVFAVDSQKLKQEWVSLLGGVVKTDNSLLGRKIRSNSSNNLSVVIPGNGTTRQLSFDSSLSGRSTPNSLSSGANTPTSSTTPYDSPAQPRFTFKDEMIGRPLSVRQEGENFDDKFLNAELSSEDEEDEEKDEADEVAQERTKIVRRETIKLIRTFKLEVHIEDKGDIYTFAFDNSVLVDQVKSYLFKHIPVLAGCNQSDYSLGVDSDDLLTVEFLRFVSSNTFIEVAVRTCGIARVGLYLRDNLKKINDERQRRTKPLKSTQELMTQAAEHRAELERLEQERLYQEKLDLEQQLLQERLKDIEKCVQTDGVASSTVATQTDDEAPQASHTPHAPQPTPQSDTSKISWRGPHTLPPSIAKKAEAVVKAAAANANSNSNSPSLTSSGGGASSGSGSSSGSSGIGGFPLSDKPKTMITKTTPRAAQAPPNVWQQVQPSVSATKRPMIIPCEGWMVEAPGDSNANGNIKSWPFAIALDGTISETPEPFFYRKHFITAKKTTNFLGSDPKYGSISFSMCSNADGYRGILFTKLGTRQISALASAAKASSASIKSRKQQMLHYLLSKLEPTINAKNLRLSVHPDMQKELLSLEERQVCSGFKFGVVYVKNGQTDENDIFSNEHGSEEWNDFLDLLGNKIQLKGWSQYNAGLDTKGDTTGTNSMYTNWKGNEIMFHVSTMLPFHPDDPQKLERKRHVGNDICVIIFQEGSTPYLANTITSHFNHIIAVVQYEKSANGYRLAFANKEGVPPFGPNISPNGLIKKDDLKEFLLTKLINGETASLLAPVFAQKLVRTREALLNYYLQQFL